MDPKSEWALGEFRDPPIELRILEHRVAGGGGAAAAAAARVGVAGGGGASGSPQQQQALPEGSVATTAAAAAGGRRRVLPVRTAYQGERLTGLLVVKFDVASADGEDRRNRWRQFGTELNVELEITTEAVASAGTAFLSEEPSLWRDYEGRENARDRGVLARSNRTVSLSPEGDQLESGAELVYALDMEVQVPVDSLGQNVVLEALVSPPSGRRSECVNTPGVAAAPSRETSGASSGAGGAGGGGGSGGGSGGSNGGGGRRRGIGGDFATRLDGLFALSRVAPVRLPVRRCFLPLRVVQPITVTSRSCPSASSPAAAAAAAAAASGGAFAGAIGRCLVALEVRNDHPAAAITVHDVEVHVDATARCGDRSSSRGFSAPGKAGGGGGGGGGGGAGGGGGGGVEGGRCREECQSCREECRWGGRPLLLRGWTGRSRSRLLRGQAASEGAALRPRAASRECSLPPGWRSRPCRWSWPPGRCKASWSPSLLRGIRCPLGGRAGISRVRSRLYGP
ncbi:unnamed protein product [Ectocarpus sp. 12 AP-2014]